MIYLVPSDQYQCQKAITVLTTGHWPPSAVYTAPSSSLVRTSASQAENTGSNPVGATNCDSRDNSLCNCLKIKAVAVVRNVPFSK